MITKRFQLIFIIFSLGVFLLMKFNGLSYRFGDGNAYFYMAKVLLDGKIPYRDFFLADPPVLILLLSAFRILFGNTLLIYQALPIIIESISAVFLFLLLKHWKNPLAFLAPLLYLFSFTILSTSDYPTGVQLTMLLFIAGVYFFEKDKHGLAGVLFALSCLTKLYAIPLVAGYLGYYIANYYIKTEVKGHTSKVWPWQTVLWFGVSSFVILLPFFASTPKSLINDLIIHQLHRPGGIDKWTTFSLFMSKEWVLLLFALLGLKFTRKQLILPFFLISIFFLFYNDLYYLYLASLLPFIVVISVSFFAWLSEQGTTGKQFAVVLFLGYFLFLFSTISDYQQNYIPQGRFTNAEEIAHYIQTLPVRPLYGSHEVVPLITLLSNRTLLGNYIDTNGQVFASHALDVTKVSEQAVKKGIYMLARITDRPDAGITETGYESFFAKDMFEKYCKRVKRFNSTSNQEDNYIGVYYCKK